MTCDQARRLISLHRPGERTEKERSALEEHLRSCAACRDVVDELQSTSQALSRLVLREPVLRDGDQFTRQIMASISTKGPRYRQAWIDALLLPAQYPSVRSGLAAVVLAAVVTLGTQAYQTQRDVHTLEQRYSGQSAVSAKERAKFEVDLSHVQITKKQKESLRRVGIVTEANTHFLITDQLLEVLWSVLERPTIQSRMLPMYSEHLDLNSVARTLRPHVRARLF